jgi:DNA replication protein DnaC
VSPHDPLQCRLHLIHRLAAIAAHVAVDLRLFYALIASRYERASLVISSNKPFSAWAEILGDAVAVGAMVDRLVHYAEIISLKGDSHRLRHRRQEAQQSD